MEIIKTRSNKAALEIVAERGLTEGTYTIEKIATARYELRIAPLVPATEELTPADHAADCEMVAVEAKAKAPRATRVNRHWNDDGSLTLYVGGIKLRRLGGEGNEDASEEELEDTEAYAEKYLGRRFPKKAGGWVWGRTTQGHNWHTKRQKALRARILAAQEAGEDASELEAELARISGKAA